MKKIITIIALILLISLVSVGAKEEFLNVGDEVVFDGKTITLNNVGSGGAIVVDVDGEVDTIPHDGTETVNGVQIHNDETFYDSNDVSQRSATIEIYKPGVSCYEDNFCDYEEIDIHYDLYDRSVAYRRITIDISEFSFKILIIISNSWCDDRTSSDLSNSK